MKSPRRARTADKGAGPSRPRQGGLSAPRSAALQAVLDTSQSTRRLAVLQKAADEPKREGGLPSALREGVESLSGMDLSDVRVHRNSPQPAQVQAHAYAQGRDIHVAPGQERHLPHEAWHAVQQAEGRVAPTGSAANGEPVNDGPRLEREADAMGERARQLSRR